MVFLTLKKKLWIQVDTTDIYDLEKIKDHFSYHVDGYFFMPQYKSGNWDGKIYIFKNGLLPYGLLFDLIKFLKKEKIEIKIDNELKNLYGNGIISDINYNLKFKPRYYQDEIVKDCLKYRKGIFIAPTACGKSLSIAYIINNIIKKTDCKRNLIIVPTTNLILQFYNDLMDYGINKDLLGKFYADEKDWDKPILISTWQSLSYDNEKIRKSEIKSLKKDISKKSTKKEDKEKFKIRLDKIRSEEYIKNVKELMEYRQNLLDEIDCVIVDECLDGDSKVLTRSGYKCIKNLEKSDIIISYNIDKNIFEEDVIIKKFENEVISSMEEDMYELTLENNKKINITGNHKVLTDKGYIKAKNLTLKDNIINI